MPGQLEIVPSQMNPAQPEEKTFEEYQKQVETVEDLQVMENLIVAAMGLPGTVSEVPQVRLTLQLQSEKKPVRIEGKLLKGIEAELLLGGEAAGKWESWDVGVGAEVEIV